MHHHIKTWAFEPKAIGSGYSGPETYQESTQTIATSDGQIALGAWRYEGRLSSSLTMQKHQIWVVTGGTADIEIEGDLIRLTEGSAICFEAPYGPKVVQASEGFTAVWISVPPSDALRK